MMVQITGRNYTYDLPPLLPSPSPPPPPKVYLHPNPHLGAPHPEKLILKHAKY